MFFLSRQSRQALVFREISSRLTDGNISKLLDIGCGDGSLVYLHMLVGIDAYGIDVEFKQGYLTQQLIASDRLKLISNGGTPRSDIQSHHSLYSWPIDSNSISVSYSSSVLEHISNLHQFAYENQRILAENGYVIHYFPSRLALIEPHIRVPFGALFVNVWYYRLMYILFYPFLRKGRSPSEMYHYMVSMCHYRTNDDILRIFSAAGLSFYGNFTSVLLRHMLPNPISFLSSNPLFVTIFCLFRSRIMVFVK